MSRAVNRVTLIGNVGRDPDLQETKGGTKVAHFSLATNRRVSQDREPKTDWHRLTFWNKLAQFAAEHIRTGDRIYVEGTLQYDSYERDGITIPTADIHVHEVVLLTPRNGAAGEGEEA